MAFAEIAALHSKEPLSLALTHVARIPAKPAFLSGLMRLALPSHTGRKKVSNLSDILLKVTVSSKSIGIGIKAEILFCQKLKLFFFQILLFFSYFLGGIQVFISLKINLALQR